MNGMQKFDFCGHHERKKNFHLFRSNILENRQNMLCLLAKLKIRKNAIFQASSILTAILTLVTILNFGHH